MSVVRELWYRWRAEAAVACPDDARGGCRGTLRMAAGGDRTAPVRFAVRRGQVKTIMVPLTARQRRALLRRGRLTATVTLRMRDRRGVLRRDRVSGCLPADAMTQRC